MSTWEEINNEILASAGNVDSVRRSKLKKLFDITNRPVLLYCVDLFNPAKINATQGDVAINLSDKDGFSEVLRGIGGRNIDIILHSPGGSPEATESLVELLRKRFESIRFIIPSIAKSAATMFAMSGDEIVLGEDAELGPTDPQMIVNNRIHPAHAILQQFKLAKSEIIKSSENLPPWLPIIQQYGPSLLIDCENAIKLTKKLVTDWLAKYMLKNQKSAKLKASFISSYLSSPSHLSHSRAIDITTLIKKGLNIKYAREVAPDLTEVINDIYLTVIQTFAITPAYKIFENHNGLGLYRSVQLTPVINPRS